MSPFNNRLFAQTNQKTENLDPTSDKKSIERTLSKRVFVLENNTCI